MTTHLSTRLVWHDRAWDGHICDHSSKNAYCIVQQHIRAGRDDDREDRAAGLPLAEWYEDNGFLDRVIASEDGPDDSIDAAEFERIARKRILMDAP